MRMKALKEGKSLNRVAIEALERGLDLAPEHVTSGDLDDLAGTWAPDPEFDAVIAEMDKTDEEMWK